MFQKINVRLPLCEALFITLQKVEMLHVTG